MEQAIPVPQLQLPSASPGAEQRRSGVTVEQLPTRANLYAWHPLEHAKGETRKVQGLRGIEQQGFVYPHTADALGQCRGRNQQVVRVCRSQQVLRRQPVQAGKITLQCLGIAGQRVLLIIQLPQQ